MHTLLYDVCIASIKDVIAATARKSRDRNTQHHNKLIAHLYSQPIANRRLQRRWPEDLIEWTPGIHHWMAPHSRHMPASPYHLLNTLSGVDCNYATKIKKNILVRVLKLCWMVDNRTHFLAACSVFLKLDRGPHFSHRWCRLNGTPSTLSNKAHLSANRIISSSTLSLFPTWSSCKYCSYRNFVYLTVNMMSPSQKYILWQRPIPLLWAGSRTVCGIPV